MAWKVALAPTADTPLLTLQQLVHETPVWAIETDERLQSAQTVREGAGMMWHPDPAYTLFKAGDTLTPAQICEAILSTLIEHHPQLATILLIGVQVTPAVSGVFHIAGFEGPITISDGTLFRIPLSASSRVPVFTFDALRWKEPQDFYDALFEVVGAPPWHGKNIDALHDSIVSGAINKIEVPYRIVVRNTTAVNDSVYSFLKQLERLVARWAIEEGCPVNLSLE